MSVIKEMSNAKASNSSKKDFPLINLDYNATTPVKGSFSDINPVDLEAGANRCAVS